MTHLSVLLCGFSCRQLDEGTKAKIAAAITHAFSTCYGVGEWDVAAALSDGKTPNWDVVIAYDTLPGVPDAMSTKLNNFRSLVTDTLFRVIPSSFGYQGRVTVRHISKISFSPDPAASKESAAGDGDEYAYEEIADQFQAERPRFTFDQLVLEPEVEQRLMEAVSILENRDKLFREWNLQAIMSPSVLLNLYGASGTGKTMTAEALASRLGKPIIRTTYADIESKYHGEGPKRLKALFLAAKRQDAVLFIDEADSMLSARLTSVNDGSAQAINSMRSQLLISLENHDGVVIFATNLIENYDKAFLTRLICLELKRPNRDARKKIWANHLFPRGNDERTLRIPLSDDIDLDVLSEYAFCGRDIRNAVKQACISTLMKGKARVDQAELLLASEKTLQDLRRLEEATGRTPSSLTFSPMEESQKKALINAVVNRKKHEAEN